MGRFVRLLRPAIRSVRSVYSIPPAQYDFYNSINKLQ